MRHVCWETLRGTQEGTLTRTNIAALRGSSVVMAFGEGCLLNGIGSPRVFFRRSPKMRCCSLVWPSLLDCPRMGHRAIYPRKLPRWRRGFSGDRDAARHQTTPPLPRRAAEPTPVTQRMRMAGKYLSSPASNARLLPSLRRPVSVVYVGAVEAEATSTY